MITTPHWPKSLDLGPARPAVLISLFLLPIFAAAQGPLPPVRSDSDSPAQTPVNSDPFVTPAPAQSAGASLTRHFKLDPNFLLNFQTNRTQSSTTNLQERARSFLADAGVDLSVSATRMFYNDRTGVLLIHGSKEVLDQVEKGLAALIPPPQVTLRATMAEFDPAALDRETREVLRLPDQPLPDPADQPGDSPTLFALTEPEVRTLFRKIESAQGIDLVTMPAVTTLSGRQVRLSVEQSVPPIITDPPLTAPGKAPKAKWSRKEPVP
jgi:hypothetical protein